MYNDTVTIFNQYDGQDGIYWYPHVLAGVDLVSDRAAITAKYGETSTDSAKLHVRYMTQNGQILIPDVNGDMLLWKRDLEWEKQGIEFLPTSIRFSPQKDFFWNGEWTDGIVKDADYTDRRYEGFYAFMNANRDSVYKISSASSPYTIIPHFEISGK